MATWNELTTNQWVTESNLIQSVFANFCTQKTSIGTTERFQTRGQAYTALNIQLVSGDQNKFISKGEMVAISSSTDVRITSSYTNHGATDFSITVQSSIAVTTNVTVNVIVVFSGANQQLKTLVINSGTSYYNVAYNKTSGTQVVGCSVKSVSPKIGPNQTYTFVYYDL